MCTQILVKHGKLDFNCETVGDLALALGVPSSSVSADPEDFCLCNAYLDNLGARKATMDEGYPFPAYIIERPYNTE